jgi:hypothetical protein
MFLVCLVALSLSISGMPLAERSGSIQSMLHFVPSIGTPKNRNPSAAPSHSHCFAMWTVSRQLRARRRPHKRNGKCNKKPTHQSSPLQL